MVEVQGLRLCRGSQFYLHVFHAESVESRMVFVTATAFLYRGNFDRALVEAMLNRCSNAQKNEEEREQTDR